MTAQQVSIDGTAFATAAAKLDAAGFEDVAQKVVKHALRQAANVVRGNVKTEASRHRRRGRLEAGVHTTWKGAGLAFALRISVTGPEAHLIVGGVGPHRIKALGSHPLPVGGVTGFAESVQHPGFRGDPFVQRGIKRSLPAIQILVDAAGAQMVAELARRMEA